MNDESTNPGQEQQKVTTHLRYEKMDTQFASQFVVNATREEVIINFSPGPLADPQTNQQLLPINSRIALTPNGAARLAQTLTNALKNLQAKAQEKTTVEEKT